MAVSTAQPLSSLLQRATLDDHDEVLKACNAALKKSKGDINLQNVKAIALLKLDRYDEALKFFEDSGEGLKSKAELEYAYTLYKAGNTKEAAHIASAISGNRGARHVEAQALYRAEGFARTVELYKNLSAQEVLSEQHDLRINRGAIDAQLQWVGEDELVHNRKPGREDFETFETAYNAACGSIARGELEQAEILLRRAKELCRFSEDLSQDQKLEELLPISVQQLYVLKRLGKSEDAEKISAEINVEAIPDLSTRNIAQNNILISSFQPSNPFVIHKIFNSSSTIPDSDKLFAFQSRAFNSSAKSVELQTFKFDGVAASTSRIISQTPSPTTSANIASLSVLNAAAHARNETGKAGLKLVLPELERRPNDVGLLATIIQMYIIANDTTSAINLFESFFKRLEVSISETDQDVRYSPGLVSILITLYKRQGRKMHVKQELAKAASYWRHKSKPPTALLQAAGKALLDSSNPEDIKVAGEIFTKLHQQNPDDQSNIAGYIASYATESPEKIKSDVEKLTPIADLVKGIDTDALETAGIPQSSNALAIAQHGISRKRGTADGGPPKAKRIRKSRLPKDYEEGKAADPERWLPLRDRSSYKPKGKKKKGKKDGGDRTQGGVVADDVGVREVVPVKSQSGSGGGGGGGAAKKKKKSKK